MERSQLTPRFHKRYSIDLDHSLKGFNHHNVWGAISGQSVVGKFQPHNTNIQHPTLKFMHRWIAMNLFPRDDIRVVHNDELKKILYAIVKKIKISPMMAMIKHRL